MSRQYIHIIMSAAVLSLALFPGRGSGAEDTAVAALQKRAAVLAQEVQQLEDVNAIETLQRTYGYYIDKALWSYATDLFTDDATLEIGASGVYKGKDRIRAYLLSLGKEGPQDGRLINQMQLQPVVHVSADGKYARGRWHSLVMAGHYKQKAYWGSVVYEDQYRKEDGVWKIAALHAYNIMYTDYARGWAKDAQEDIWPGKRPAPDLPSSVDNKTYPDRYFAPFHYPNPVTGGPVNFAGAGPAPGMTIPAGKLEQTVNDLDRRLQRLDDVNDIERLQHVYGYYLDKQQWDDLAGLSAADASIEIAQRGIYTGRKRVRDNLNLYGEPGVHHGVLHNHIQLQAVIHIADDGKTAHARARALSMLGTYGRVGIWGASIYENEYVKENGVWKFKIDHLFTTTFTTYDEGWAKDPRPAPGISKTNPPDQPPSIVYQAFPKYYVPPFDYPHPVTGEVIKIPE